MLIAMSHIFTAQANTQIKTIYTERLSIPQRFTTYGVVESHLKSTLTAETSGQITEINFDVNDPVERGQILLRLNATSQQANVTTAEAALSGSQVALQEASQSYRRTKDLWKKKLIAVSVLDQAKAKLKTTQAKVNAAKANIEAANQPLSQSIITAPFSGIVLQRHMQLDL